MEIIEISRDYQKLLSIIIYYSPYIDLLALISHSKQGQYQLLRSDKLPQIITLSFKSQIIIVNHMDIDSPNFDPKRYVLTMLKQNTIKELIRKNNEIDEEIKVHDHEIQSLVFQNYSKFISSIDTVRQMKDNICMVDDKLKILDSSMDKISDLALKIDETFKFKRKQIQKLDTVNKDLQKLKNLCDFPNVLKQDLTEYKSIPENRISLSFAEGPRLFNKSITVYQECFKTLQDLKSEPLIQPIYKESVNKIEEVRSILRTRQVQFNKEHSHSKALRAITKNLIIISDQQNQVSVLRSYFHSWKDRLIFKKKPSLASQNQQQLLKYDKSLSLTDLLSNSPIPEINQEFWTEFLKEFEFLYNEIYSKLILSDEISLLVNNYTKDVFNWAIDNELDEIPYYCSSIKVYVHVNHIVSSNLKNALSKIQPPEEDSKNSPNSREKVYQELNLKLNDKIENLGNSMLNFVFSRLKLSFMEQVIESKKSANSFTISEQLLKETYIKILGPIKETFKNNFQPVLNDLEHMNSSYENVYSSKQKYEHSIHEQIDNLIRFLSVIISLTSETVTEELYQQINPSKKLHKLEKSYIEGIVNEYIEIADNGCWFAVAHNYLNYLCNQLGKKIIESAHKRIEVSQNHNYAGVFSFIKSKIGVNLVNLVEFYSNKVRANMRQKQMLVNINEFVEIVNSVFPDSRRGFLKKPSFLSEGNSYIHETELMTAKKLRIIEKQAVGDRSNVLTVFIRRTLKLMLLELRTKKDNKIDLFTIYSLVQICYEMGNVEEQSQICAFYQLLLGSINKNLQQPKREELEKSFSEVRKVVIEKE